MSSKEKAIFKYRVAKFLMENDAEFLGSTKGFIAERPSKETWFFKKDERLLKALDKYHTAK